MSIKTDQRNELIQQALDARQNTYSPYSGYAVGAALLTEAGRLYSGTNIENAAYPVSICAERVAVFKAVSEGDRKIIAIAIASDNGGPPCGSCRQVLSEFGSDVQVFLVDGEGNVTLDTNLRELLPRAFGPDQLAKRSTE